MKQNTSKMFIHKFISYIPWALFEIVKESESDLYDLNNINFVFVFRFAIVSCDILWWLNCP